MHHSLFDPLNMVTRWASSLRFPALSSFELVVRDEMSSKVVWIRDTDWPMVVVGRSYDC